ncbi:MAG: phage virion morphogenesis protein [Proteobacteria bacterium]|nr:phage virion morphogenesis protein [Pseudomonadota bacterium]
MFDVTEKTKSAQDFALKLDKVVENIDGLLENIGVVLDETTKDRMNEEKSPDLQSWQELSPFYKQHKKGKKILQESGFNGGLIQSLNASINGNELTYGSNKVYAAIHQFGGTIKPKKAKALKIKTGKGKATLVKKVTILQREYLGFGVNESAAIHKELDALLGDL